MSAKELMVNGKPLSTLRVVDLKEELEKRGLSKSGSKKDLADRLRMNVLLENQRSSQGSADEEQLPNISTREQLAEQNPFIRDYFQSQAELYHSQKVVKKLYEGMSHTPEEGEQPPAPVPKENEESNEPGPPSPSEKSKLAPKEPVEASGDKSGGDVSDSSNSNHVEQVVKDKEEESNGTADAEENVKPNSPALTSEKKVSASEIKGIQSAPVSVEEEAAVEQKSPVVQERAVTSGPSEEPVKVPDVDQKKEESPSKVELPVEESKVEKVAIIKEPESVAKPVKESEVEEKSVKESQVKEKPVQAPEIDEKSIKEREVEEKPVEEHEVMGKPFKEPEVEEKPVKEPEVEEKPVKEPEVEEEPVKEPEVKEEPVKEPEVEEEPVKEPEIEEKLVEDKSFVKKPIEKKSVKEAVEAEVVEKHVDEPLVDEPAKETKVVEKPEVEGVGKRIKDLKSVEKLVKEPEVVQKSVVREPEVVEKHVEVSEDTEKVVASPVAVNELDKGVKKDKFKVADHSEKEEVERSSRRRLVREKRSATPEEVLLEKVVPESKERKKRRARSPEKPSQVKKEEEAVVEKASRFSPIRNDHPAEDLDYEDEESDEKREPDESTWKRRNLRGKGRAFTPEKVEKVKVGRPKSPITHHKNEENSLAPKISSPSSKSSRFSPSSENPVLEKPAKPIPIRSEQEDVDEVLDYGYEEADLKRDHEGIAWSRRILRLKNRCSVIEKTEKKWNRIDRKPVVVTSSVLETFFPDVKLLPESEVKLEERIPKEPELEKDHVKTERELPTPQIQNSNSTESNLPNIKRKISIIPFEETVKELTPPRNQPSQILVITNLTRPFTLMQLKELLQRTGTIEDIWVDKIKSKCLAKFEKEAEAEETRAALHGIKWPPSNPKALFVDFATESEFEEIRTKEAGEKKLKFEKPDEAKVVPVREWDLGKRSRSRSPGRTKRSRSGDRDRKRSRKSASPHSRRSPHHDKISREHDTKEEAQAKALDELFRKTTTTPCLYWLPLTPQQISEKEELRRKRMVERERRLAEMEKLRPR